MDDDKLRKMLMDPSITIDDILAEQLADDFRKATGIAASERLEDAIAFQGTNNQNYIPGGMSAMQLMSGITPECITDGTKRHSLTVRQFPQ